MKIPYLIAAAVLAAALTSGCIGDTPKVPHGGAFGCKTCHEGGGFKEDFGENGKVWDERLASLDSDGDGVANGVELLDPEGRWRRGDDDPPAGGRLPTNPDDATSFPAR